jgi:hypothetical protein
MRTKLLALGVVSAVIAGISPVMNVTVAHAASSCALAGYGDADATYPVGAQSGQYADTRDSGDDIDNGMDPQAQQVKDVKSYGVASRLNVRVIVVRGCDGKTVALMKDDHYLSQDAVQRRIGQILAANGSSVTYENLLASATHNHNSPYQVTPSAGVWAFQDAFDARSFEAFARDAAAAVMEAEANLQPARMGATETYQDIFKANIQGADVGDDGTPVGYPKNFGDHGVAVIRFDNAETGAPIATWANWGEHGESLETTNLISADWWGPLERQVELVTGAPVVMSQGDVGSSEGPYEGWTAPPKWLPDGTRRAWAHTNFAQAERGARYLADSIIQGFDEIGSGGGAAPYESNFVVASYNGWIPLPKSHPYPSVGNCRTQRTVGGEPGAPAAGLPDCERSPADPQPAWDATGVDPNDIVWDNLKEHGIPVPENYDVTSFGTVEENMRLRLQAVRLGDVILGSCSCEAQVDIIKNFESRADNVVGNLWDGYEWKCTRPGYGEGDPKADHQWTCEYPDNGPNGTKTFTFSDYDYRHMLAQVHNDAGGWDDLEYTSYAPSEPSDLSKLKGNFTWEELGGSGDPRSGESVLPTTGYKMAVGLGHTGDYAGYTVSYREYMEDDTYRKALTCCGPHTADYMSTNLVYMAQALKGGPDVVADNPYNQAQAADEARQVAFTTSLGQATSAAYDAWYAALPNDVGSGEIVTQPKDIQRFDAASFSWKGGSNAVDDPVVTVQRLTDSGWSNYANQSGEVQTFLKFPEAFTGIAQTWAGQQEWEWTANFEAFDFGPRRDIDPRGPQVPEGEYRFVVNGKYRAGGTDQTYDLVSKTFSVSKWRGIKVQELRAEPGGVSFTVAGEANTKTEIAPGLPKPQIRYPRTYAPAPVIRFIRDDGDGLCKTCTFRPWAAGSDVASATVTVERADGTTEQVPATLSDGRWRAALSLYDGDRAYVAPGGIVDTYGEINGQPSNDVNGSGPRPAATSALAYGGATGGQFSDQATLSARLTNQRGNGIAGADVVFTLSNAGGSVGSWTVSTDSSGVAARSVELTAQPGDYQLTARFAGSSHYLESAAQTPFAIAKEDSRMMISVTGRASKKPLITAHLFDSDSSTRPITGATVTFYEDGAAIGQAQTNLSGVAKFQPADVGKGVRRVYEARYAGDSFYVASSAKD